MPLEYDSILAKNQEALIQFLNVDLKLLKRSLGRLYWLTAKGTQNTSSMPNIQRYGPLKQLSVSKFMFSMPRIETKSAWGWLILRN